MTEMERSDSQLGESLRAESNAVDSQQFIDALRAEYGIRTVRNGQLDFPVAVLES